MSAKSALQLPVSPLNHARGVALQARSTYVILLLALTMASAAWLLERFEGRFFDSAAEAPVELTAVTESSASEAPPAVSDVQAAAPAAEEARPRENSRYRTLAHFLAKRYKVSQAVTLDLVTIAYAAGHQIGIDPLLILAVMSVESRFNPIAESVAGAKGLMQIIPRYHSEKFQEHGGVKAVFDPETNILVGSQIIKEYLARTGNLKPALQLYGGAPSDENEVYFDKVMTEKQRLLQVLRKSS